MKLSVVAENRPNDKVVVLMPDAVKKIKSEADIDVLVEEGAGTGIGISDNDFADGGALIVDRRTAYAAADMIVRRNAPTRKELEMMSLGSISMSMIHHDGVPQRRIDLEETGIVGLALDFIVDSSGEREVYLFDITAENGVMYSYRLIDKKPEDCLVKIMGYGHLGKSAARYASKMRSDVEILNRKHTANISEHLKGVDILINAINWPLDKRGKEFIMTRKDLRYMREGSVLIDLVVNPKGMSPIKTCRPTYVDNPHYTTDGVIHACVWGWPGMTPKKTSEEYSRLLPKYIVEIANNGPLNVGQNLLGAYVNIDALKELGWRKEYVYTERETAGRDNIPLKHAREVGIKIS